MKGQVHYICVEVPNLKEGRDLVANCSAKIQNAQFAGEAIEADKKDLNFNPLRDCRKCWNKGFDKHYLYPIVDGEKRIKRGQSDAPEGD